jgi:hypothetical protein
MTDEIKQPEEISTEDLLEYYKTFSNSMVYGPMLYNGIKLILVKMDKIEEKLLLIEEKMNGNKQ